MKRHNPYTALKEEFRQWVNKVEFRRKFSMWLYPKAKLNEGWKLGDLWERTKAAEQLGFDVILLAADEGIIVKYVEKCPQHPFCL